MLTFGLLACLTNLGYCALALAPPTVAGLSAVVAIDNLFGAMAMAVFVAWLMSLCSRSYSATQYALLYGAYTAEAKLCGATSGFAVNAAGWPTFFALTVVAAVPGLVLLALMPPKIAMPEDGR
jgi:PAT family beta-lactamase induction signal transducer AmpG